MKFWQALSFSEPDQLMDLAKICDEVGFEGAFVSDHMFYPGDYENKYPYTESGKLDGFTADTAWPDPWVAIASMAGLAK